MWQTIFIQPLYNLLIILTNTLWGHLALGVIALTVIVKLVLTPLTIKGIKAQLLQQKLKPEMDKIQKTITDKTEQSKAIMELYKSHGTSPFSGCLPILIQLPIIIALYRALTAGAIQDTSLLYSGVQLHEHFFAWLGGIDLYQKSWELALLAGLTQFYQMYNSPTMSAPTNSDDPMASMTTSMKYVLPVMITFFAYAVPAAVALYWVTSNVVTIITEKLIRKNLKV